MNFTYHGQNINDAFFNTKSIEECIAKVRKITNSVITLPEKELITKMFVTRWYSDLTAIHIEDSKEFY